MARPPGADYPANILAAHSVCSEQDHAARSADRFIATLAIRAGVDDYDQVWIVENLGRCIEVHAVLFDITRGLEGIPFEFHAPYLIRRRRMVPSPG